MIRAPLAKALLLLIGLMSGVLLEARVFGPLRGQLTEEGFVTRDDSAPPDSRSSENTRPSATATGPSARPDARASISTGPMPIVSVDQPTFDFGTVLQGGSITHEFTLRNTGDAPLIVERVRPACGCTVAELASKRIDVGEATTLKATLASKGRVGPQDRAIFVETNDPKTPRLRLALVGTINSLITKEPASFALGRVVASGDSSSGHVDVRASEGFQFRVTDVRTSHDEVVADVQEIEPGRHVRVSASLKRSSLPDGQFVGWVRLVTDDQGPYREIPITVRARIGAGGPIATGDTPEIAGPALDGGSVALASSKGKPTIVVFWASWCGHCRREIPQLVALHEKYHHQGLSILGVNTDQDRSKAIAACDQWQVPWPNIHFDSSGSPGFKNPLSTKYEVRGIPAVFLIDRDGKVLASGLRGAALESLVAKVLDGESLAKR